MSNSVHLRVSGRSLQANAFLDESSGQFFLAIIILVGLVLVGAGAYLVWYVKRGAHREEERAALAAKQAADFAAAMPTGPAGTAPLWPQPYYAGGYGGYHYGPPPAAGAGLAAAPAGPAMNPAQLYAEAERKGVPPQQPARVATSAQAAASDPLPSAAGTAASESVPDTRERSGSRGSSRSGGSGGSARRKRNLAIRPVDSEVIPGGILSPATPNPMGSARSPVDGVAGSASMHLKPRTPKSIHEYRARMSSMSSAGGVGSATAAGLAAGVSSPSLLPKSSRPGRTLTAEEAKSADAAVGAPGGSPSGGSSAGSDAPDTVPVVEGGSGVELHLDSLSGDDDDDEDDPLADLIMEAEAGLSLDDDLEASLDVIES